MKKKIIIIVALICLFAGIIVAIKCIPAIQNKKQSDNISKEVSGEEETLDDTNDENGTEGESETGELEIPLESGVEDDQTGENFSGDDGDVELPAVPIQ